MRPFVATFDDTPVRGELRARLVLVGDAGKPRPDVLHQIGVVSGKRPDRTAVVYLGDNIYEKGLPDGPAIAEREVLDAQISAVGSNHGVFVPGNHDWGWGRDGIVRQMEHVEASARLRFLPRNGCPGPATFALDGLLLVALDTESLIGELPPVSDCGLGHDPRADIREQVRTVLRHVDDDLVVVIGHHPPWTLGPHGGFFDWQDHLFPVTRWKSWAWIPLPVIGSVYPLVRRHLLGNRQDAFSEPYRQAHAYLADAFSVYGGDGPLIFAGGHDHSLQVLADLEPWDYVLVSGSASKTKLTSVTDGPETRFAHLAHGFMVLDLYDSSDIWLRVFDATGAVSHATQLH